MKRLVLIPVFLSLPLLGGCIAAVPKQPEMTQLQIRQMQTREYDAPRKIVMEAALAFLQDEGYIIKNADSDLGIIHATRDVELGARWSKFFAKAFNDDATWETNSVHEMSVNVRKFGETSKVRIISQVKVYDNKGAVSRVRQINEENFYRDIFSKIDKGVFLQKQDL